MRFPAGNLLIPGILFIGLQSTPNEEIPPFPEISHAEAWDLILDLPEVREMKVRIPEWSHGEASLFVMDDGDEAPGIWVFFVGEERPTQVVRWHTMRFSSFTGEISVWDTGVDGYVPLEEWRRLIKSR